MPRTTIDLPFSPEEVASGEARLQMAHRTLVPVLTMRDIATAVVEAVAALPDRSSPDNWPEAMLVTGKELHLIIMQEFDKELG